MHFEWRKPYKLLCVALKCFLHVDQVPLTARKKMQKKLLVVSQLFVVTENFKHYCLCVILMQRNLLIVIEPVVSGI